MITFKGKLISNSKDLWTNYSPVPGELAYCEDTGELWIGTNNSDWVSIGSSNIFNMSSPSCATCKFNIEGQCTCKLLNPSGHDFPIEDDFYCENWALSTMPNGSYGSTIPFASMTPISIDYADGPDWSVCYPIPILRDDKIKVFKENDNI